MDIQKEPTKKTRSTSAKVMGLEIDLLEKESFMSKLLEYLSNNGLRVVCFVSVELLEECSNDSERKDLLEQFDLLIPGEKAILSLHHEDLLEAAGMVVDYKSLIPVLQELGRIRKNIYLLVRDEKEMEVYQDICSHWGSLGNIVGCSCVDENFASEAIINDINIHTPDILLLSMDSPDQEEWIAENKLKLNARLCLVMGDVTNDLLKESRGVPELLRKLGMSKLYYFHRRNWNWLNVRRRRIFRKKMVNHNKKNS